MGWAKYCEDNIEIMLERQFILQKTEIAVACRMYSPAEKTCITAIDARKTKEKPKYEDRYIVCKDCGKKFLFSAKSQKHFAIMNWDAPKRCGCCRSHRNTRYLMCSTF